MSEDPTTISELEADLDDLGDALAELGRVRDPVLARQLARLVTAVAIEATRSSRLTKILTAAIAVPIKDAANVSEGESPSTKPRPHRRTPGVLDPFVIFSEVGESGLHDRLAALDLEQLRDIVAEHGMDHDRLAMRWKDPDRVIGRIVEKVSARASKGSAFRSNS
ncbi:hypothetical protein Aple_042510 [Acrocarpospora pleiomorpha]|uniref:Uncharacterized protein n=1 Tax=Acrocarpospora pleiomorpha TaxID=90975 RepID=A0A5M3XIP7_9ACTN|nr:hypothetical protein [Acrocarpospora pleiomorpha]GES21355.1 hypothetical protein Aple_042510 [Acrocarpospora pleiomorpha]